MRYLKGTIMLVGLVAVLAGCREKELDMTVTKETAYQEYDIHSIRANDAWNFTIVQDDGPSFVELEYSVFLQEYMHIQYVQDSFYFYLGMHPHLPSNTVLNVTIHTDYLRGLSLNNAATAVLEGDFDTPSLWVTLDGASTCKGGVFTGENASLALNGASQMVDFSYEGQVCSIRLDGASFFKGMPSVTDSLLLSLDDASWITTYGGTAPSVNANATKASSINMSQTEVERMQLNLSESSEAYVNVRESLQAILRDASTLYYHRHNGLVLDVDLDETSQMSPLSSKL